jgi:hypothetical protein
MERVMKTQAMHNDAGGADRLRGAEYPAVSPTGVPNRGICSWGTVIRWPPRLWWGDDAFCAFSGDGVPFLVIEPFGDNDCYWIVAEEPDPAARPLIERVREVFGAAWG